MSLLEDVFLQDEANEAEELERVIEGDEFEQRRRSDSDENSEKEDEAEEDKRRVDPTKSKTTRVVKNPRFILNPARLTGPRGIQVIPEHFKDFKFKGKGHETEDLDLVLKRLEHWAYRLYPKFQFEDCLKKIEMLGKKRPVAVHLHKIRSDQFLSEDIVVQKDSSDEDTPMPVQEEDEFDKLLQQQIELARSTPAPNSAKKPVYDRSASPKDKRTTSLMMPKATSSPSINDEQRERMLRSRKLAEERRLARLKNNLNTADTDSRNPSESNTDKVYSSGHDIESCQANLKPNDGAAKDSDEIGVVKKHNRSNVIDSSDDEESAENCVSIVADVHTVRNETSGSNEKESESMFDEIRTNDKEYVTEDSLNTIEVLNSELNKQTDLIEDTKDNSGMQENVLNEANREIDNNRINTSDNFSEKSDEYEPLKYDDSDMNIETNDHSVSNDNGGDTISGNHSYEETPHINEADNIKESDKETQDCKVESHIANGKPDSVPTEGTRDGLEKDGTDVSHEVIEDVMDVDFSEDF